MRAKQKRARSPCSSRANVSVPVGRRGFRLLFAEQEVEVGEGSGFVFRSDDKRSLILTNAHVVLQTNEDQRFDKPSWVGDEVGHDPRYFNSNLIAHPYSKWAK